MGERKLANNNAIVATAKARSLRVTPQKARRVVNMIRGARLDEALNICKFSPQVAVSEDLYSLLNSAFANAKQKNPNIRDAKELWVAEALVDEGFTMKRYRPRAQGRGYQILKRSSQISVVISDDRNYRSHGPSKGGKKPVAQAPADNAADTATVTKTEEANGEGGAE